MVAATSLQTRDAIYEQQHQPLAEQRVVLGDHHAHGSSASMMAGPPIGLVTPSVARAAWITALEILFYPPAKARGPDEPGLGRPLPFGGEAVVEGQLAAVEVAADQEAVPRGGVMPFPSRSTI
jgi:hypothetical protein